MGFFKFLSAMFESAIVIVAMLSPLWMLERLPSMEPWQRVVYFGGVYLLVFWRGFRIGKSVVRSAMKDKMKEQLSRRVPDSEIPDFVRGLSG